VKEKKAGKSLLLRTLVGNCLVVCVFIFGHFAFIQAVLFIGRAVSSSWQRLRGTSVGILSKHDIDLSFVGEEHSVC